MFQVLLRILNCYELQDIKFAQAEVHHLTTLIVMSRFKRDYVTLAPNKSHKLTSSFDQRITLTLDKDTLAKKEHFLLQVSRVKSEIGGWGMVCGNGMEDM